MKHVCLLCGRTSPDNNLFCQETYCPAEMSPTVLDSGDWFGDVEIVRPLTVLRSGVVYDAVHQRRRVLLKVAHPGLENKARLKREADFLQSIAGQGEGLPSLPALRPAYAYSTVGRDGYGKMMLQGHLLYFFIFEHFEGEPLSAVLLKNPQLWINHVGWLTTELAATINFLHQRGLYHYGLTPDGMLVRFDPKTGAPRILLCDLGIAGSRQTLNDDWYPFCVPPAYTAPELADRRARSVVADYRTDVYGLGLVLYEMLVGEPAFAHRTRSDAEVYRAVALSERVRMTRTEDVDAVADIALRAASPEMNNRQPHAAQIGEELIKEFGHGPPEKKGRMPSLNQIIMLSAVALAIAFLVALMVWLAFPGATT